MQEAFPREVIEDLGYNIAIHGQKTFNGVAILSKSPIEDVTPGLPTFSEDDQARYIEAIIGTIRVASVYVPNGQAVNSDKYHYKMSFLEKLRQHLDELLKFEEAIVIGGDYNIAPTDEDVADPTAWDGEVLCSPRERQAFQALLHLGYTDAIRINNTGKGPYTWWDYRSGAWQNNKGLRIDHLLLSPQAVDLFEEAGVDRDPRAKEKASDHTPVWCALSVK